MLRQARQQHPDNPHLQLDQAIVSLTLGHWAEGWQQYESRRRPGTSPAAVAAAAALPAWRAGQDIRGKTVLLTTEQGLGDTLMFLRYVPPLLARGAQVVLQCSARLHRLLPEPWPGCRVIDTGPTTVRADLQCPLPSLPHLLGMAEPLGMDLPYLHTLAARRAHWQALLGERPGPTLRRIGLSWAGNPKYPEDRRRSLPLEPLRRALQPLAGFEFVSLQLELPERDRDALAAWPELRVLDSEQEDMADAAALMEELDGIISVDTSLAHLAGALQRPLWLLLAHNADWRWNLGSRRTAWYPSATLLRQPAAGDWPAVLAQLTQALQAPGGLLKPDNPGG